MALGQIWVSPGMAATNPAILERIPRCSASTDPSTTVSVAVSDVFLTDVSRLLASGFWLILALIQLVSWLSSWRLPLLSQLLSPYSFPDPLASFILQCFMYLHIGRPGLSSEPFHYCFIYHMIQQIRDPLADPP
jgi:hypothetical protein